jgi:hypothetical protein
MNLEGKALRYLIGGDDNMAGQDDEVIEFSFDAEAPPKRGIGIKYCNLLDEKYDAKKKSGQYGPYAKPSDVAKGYGEGQIDPNGPGWMKNLTDQFGRAKSQGFQLVELDNPDSYDIKNVLQAIDLAASYGLAVIAKNPGLMEGSKAQQAYVGHKNVVGIIVEKDAGTPQEMDNLRRAVQKPSLPVWFVFFGKGKAKTQADDVAQSATPFKNMGVTYSTVGEYKNATDLLRPNPLA